MFLIKKLIWGIKTPLVFIFARRVFTDITGTAKREKRIIREIENAGPIMLFLFIGTTLLSVPEKNFDIKEEFIISKNNIIF